MERPVPPVIADERTMLRVFLDCHRATLAMKCAGLSDQQLRQRAVPSSALSLLGLVRHMAEVERTWFRRVINGEVSLRLVMLHLIHEYARHNGHADFLREAIDGAVGV
jgi:hypothetical protein